MNRIVIVFFVLCLCVGSANGNSAEQKLALLESAVAGDQDAQFLLAESYREESIEMGILFGDLPRLSKAVHWYEQAAQKGHLQSRYALLEIYNDPIDQAFDQADPEWQKKWFLLAEKMAKEGDQNAQVKLADYHSRERYFENTDVGQCIKQAVYWYSQVLEGLGTGQEIVYATVDITEKITRMDIETKITKLGDLNPEVEEKKKKEKFLLNNDIKRGSLESVIKLGDIWSTGKDENLSMAVKSYLYAAEKNNPEAQIKLARLRYQQASAPDDYYEAYLWAMAAAAGNNMSAQTLLLKIKEKIKEQIPAEHMPQFEADIKKAIKRLGRQ
jgi:TPR repeat protein